MQGYSLLDPKWETMSRDELLAVQEERLKALLKRAWEKIPFYRRIWKKDDFPPTT